MEWSQVVRAVMSRKLPVLILVLSATVNSVLITYVVEERFKSSVQVLIRPRNEVKITPTADKKEILNFPLPAVVPFEVLAQTYSEVITSREVVERVVRTLGLDKKDPERRWWKRVSTWVKDAGYDLWDFLKYGRIEREDPFEEAVGQVQQRLSVTPTKNAYVFAIEFDAKDPRVAAAVVNMATTTFLEFTGRLFHLEAENARKFIEQQIHDSANQLQETRGALRDFKNANQIVRLDTELTAKINSLSGFEGAAETTRHDIQASRAEIRDMEEQLRPVPMYVKSSATVEDNPLVTELRSSLAKQEVELSGLAKGLTPGHPKVVALEASIAEAKRQLAHEEAKVVSAETSSISNIHKVLTEDLVKARAKLEGLLAKERDLERIIDSRRRELKSMPGKESRLNQLELEVRAGEDTQKQIAQAYEEARIREADITNDVRVISAAVPPTYPNKPIKIYYAGLSMAMALVIGVGIALVGESLSPTIRSVDDVESGLGLPVLTTIPVIQPQSPRGAKLWHGSSRSS